MMQHLNSVYVIGKYKKARINQAGSSKVASFQVSVCKSYKDKAGEWQKIWDNVPVKAWGKIAELVEGLPDGCTIMVRGSIKTESWEKDGKKNYATLVNVAAPEGFVQLQAEPGPAPQQHSFDGGNPEDVAF